MFSLRRRSILLLLAVLAAFSLNACRGEMPAPSRDPREGMVEVSNGAGGTFWITPLSGLPVSKFKASDFMVNGDGSISYGGGEYTAYHGIDVSEFQGEVDWSAVKGAGMDFVILRAGYRGWSEGSLYEDARFAENLKGAQEAGLLVGCYFFSQAVNTSEAEEEASFLLSVLDGAELPLPVFFDWEEIGGEARTYGVSSRTLTDCCLAFSRVMEEAGYRTGVYFYRSLGYQLYELDRLGELCFWAGAVGDSPDFYYEHSFWQYSITGSVPGIETDVDRDIWFVPVPSSPPVPELETVSSTPLAG